MVKDARPGHFLLRGPDSLDIVHRTPNLHRQIDGFANGAMSKMQYCAAHASVRDFGISAEPVHIPALLIGIWMPPKARLACAFKLRHVPRILT